MLTNWICCCFHWIASLINWTSSELVTRKLLFISFMDRFVNVPYCNYMHFFSQFAPLKIHAQLNHFYKKMSPLVIRLMFSDGVGMVKGCFSENEWLTDVHLMFFQDTALGKPHEMFRFESDPSTCEGEQLCASLNLTSATWAALSDGTGKLTLLRTSKRGDSSHIKWEVGENNQFFGLTLPTNQAISL